MSHAVQFAIEVNFVGYLLLVCCLLIGWMKAMRGAAYTPAIVPDKAFHEPLVSVVIAARNEAKSLPMLISDLRVQQGCRFEVIIVDDGSEDDTLQRAIESTGGDKRFCIMKSSGEGKKAALSTGIRHANGQIILTSDADCRIGSSWVTTMTIPFADPSTMMVFGAVRITGSSLFDRIQSLEFATLIGAGAATAAFDAPTMCNGANLAYRRQVFESVGGYDDNLQIPSGDDEFLMRKVYDAFPFSVHFCGAREALVTTTPSTGLPALFDQRVRWAGKWRLNGNLTSTLLALWIFSIHAIVIVLPWMVLTGIVEPLVAGVALLAKAAIEYVYTRSLQRAHGLSWSWPAFLILQFVYSYYVVIVAICAKFVTFEWKGRRLKQCQTSP